MTGDMLPAGRGDELVPAGDLRASHQDRDRVVDLLRAASVDGRLAAEEFDERLEAALTARTYGELAVLTRDLPGTPGFVPVTPVPQPKDLVRIDCGSGQAKRVGRWVVPRRIQVQVTSGNVTLDFTEAVITEPVLHIDAQVRSGGLTLVTRPGVVVDPEDVAVRSGTVRVREPWGTDVPAVLRILVSGKVTSGRIVARPPRRSFWQWLRRRPRPYALDAARNRRP